MAARVLVLLCIILAVPFGASTQLLPVGNRTHWNKSRGFAPFRYAAPEGIVIDDTLATPLSDHYVLREETMDFSLRFTAANSHNHPSKSYPYRLSDGSKKKINFPDWRFFVKGSENDSLIVRVKTNEVIGALSSETVVTISAYNSSEPLNKIEINVNDGIDCFNGNNNWVLSVKDDAARLAGGNRSMKQLLTIPVKIGMITEFGFTAYPGACLTISDITFIDNSIDNLMSSRWSDPDYLADYLATSKDPMEGYWVIFDRNLEESLLQLGGDYRLALVKDDGDNYALIYLSGARINENIWKPGMIKASLIPEPFPGIFNVVWYDAQGFPLGKDIKAQTGEGETLTIQFPYQSSSLRLRRLPQ